MPHPDPDDLALVALGESLGDPVDTHVAHCEICRREIESFQQTIGLAELSNYGEDAPAVSEHVWQAITADLGLGSRTSSGADSGTVGAGFVPTQPAPPNERDGGSERDGRFDPTPIEATAIPETSAIPEAPSKTEPIQGNSPTAIPVLRVVPGSTPPPVDSASMTSAKPTGPSAATPAPARRRSRWVAPLAAAVIGIALGAGAVAVLENRSTTDTVEAVAPLTPVPTGPLAGQDGQQLGQADLVASPTGPQVRVNAADLPAAKSSAYEVWLFGNDGKMVSLGTLADGNGSFTVPPGINTAEYRVVDISDEPPDGNPAHSGVSLIRGEFS